MKTSTLERLDRLLATSDHESSEWCDGGQSEIADAYLGVLEDADWLQLKSLCQERDAQWQGCLMTVLRPAYGVACQDIMVGLAYSEDTEVAFLAMRSISFYCGVNLNSQGEFFDESIVNVTFRNRLRDNDRFRESIPTIGAYLGKNYGLLQRILRSQE